MPITPPAPSWPTTCSYSFKFPFWSRMFRPGQASRRQTSFSFSPFHLAATILGLRTISRLLLNLRHGPCNPINLYRMVLAGQQACPQRLSRPFLSHLGRSNHPVSRRIYSCWSLRPSYLVGSKRAFEHNVVFSDPAGFRSLRSPENRHYVITLPRLYALVLWIIL